MQIKFVLINDINYMFRTKQIPLSISDTFSGDSFETLSINLFRSIVVICETFATESFGSFVSFLERKTLPGASLSASFGDIGV
jgi:hypothetical protein